MSDNFKFSDVLWAQRSSQLVPHRELSPELFDTVARFKMRFWPYDYNSQIQWLKNETEPDDRHLLLFKDGELIGYLRLTRRGILGLGEQPSILGVSTVAIAPALQGRGFGVGIMSLANDVILTETPTFGVLCCAADKVSFYQKCGWAHADRDFVHSTPPHRRFFQDDYVLTFGLTQCLPRAVLVSGKRF